MRWSFRPCIRGELYRDGECQPCPQGFYSKEDNNDLSVRECISCPVDASECYADIIVLDKGYWALSKDSVEMTECPMGRAACPGGVQEIESLALDISGDGDANSSSICRAGYTGALCAVCVEEYYYSPGSNSCEPCS